MAEKQPLIQQRIMLRLAICLGLIAAALFGWYFLNNFLLDPDYGSIESSGWIVALRSGSNGSQAVLLEPGGGLVASPNYRSGGVDRDPVWQPDGQRIFFSSDRDPTLKGFHIFRWNPAIKVVKARSSGTRALERPEFQIDGKIDPPYDALIVSSGVVVDFDPKDGTMHQLLPPEGRSPSADAEGEGGFGTEFGPDYTNLGTSFRQANWCKNRKYIAGIMHRDQGDTLVVVCVKPDPNAQPGSFDDGRPHGVAAGDHIDMTIDPKSGDVVYTVQNVQFIDPDNAPPQFIKDGKAIPPFRHVVAVFNPAEPQDPATNGPIAQSNDDKLVFAGAAPAPEGDKVAFSAGRYDASGFHPVGLVVCPLSVGGAEAGTMIVRGGAMQPDWSPDEKRIAFVMPAAGETDVFVANADGSGLIDLTKGEGDFSRPRFSPSAK